MCSQRPLVYSKFRSCEVGGSPGQPVGLSHGLSQHTQGGVPGARCSTLPGGIVLAIRWGFGMGSLQVTKPQSLSRNRFTRQFSARVRDAARARRAAVASMDPMQRAARHAMRMAGTTALQDLLAEVAGRRREAHDTAARLRDFARARRAAVLAARMLGGTRTVHVRRVTLLLAGETAPRRARVRAAAAAAAANSGPIGTIGLR